MIRIRWESGLGEYTEICLDEITNSINVAGRLDRPLSWETQHLEYRITPRNMTLPRFNPFLSAFTSEVAPAMRSEIGDEHIE